MNAAERTMPIVEARYSELRRAWLVALPGGVGIEARTPFDVEVLVARHASGAAGRLAGATAPEGRKPGT